MLSNAVSQITSAVSPLVLGLEVGVRMNNLRSARVECRLAEREAARARLQVGEIFDKYAASVLLSFHSGLQYRVGSAAPGKAKKLRLLYCPKGATLYC